MADSKLQVQALIAAFELAARAHQAPEAIVQTAVQERAAIEAFVLPKGVEASSTVLCVIEDGVDHSALRLAFLGIAAGKVAEPTAQSAIGFARSLEEQAVQQKLIRLHKL